MSDARHRHRHQQHFTAIRKLVSRVNVSENRQKLQREKQSYTNPPRSERDRGMSKKEEEEAKIPVIV